MPDVFTEGRHAAEFVMREGVSSRANIKIAASQTIVPGTVLGGRAVVADATAVAAVVAGGTGNATIAMNATPLTSAAKDGVYRGVCMTATTVRWEDPDGVAIGNGTHGTLFAAGGIRVTVTAGGTPNVAGDAFTVTVAIDAGDVEYVAHDPTATDGSETATAIALYGATTGVSESAAISAITRNAEVNGNVLTYAAGITAPNKANVIQDLAAKGIIVR